MKAYGAELVLTDGAGGMSAAIEKAKELAREIPNAFIPGQFDNPANPEAHRLTTGPEIFDDTDGEVDFFVAGVGTGGTLSGVGEYLKSRKPDVKVIAVEPYDSPVLSGGAAGAHGLQGIGAGFIPGALNTEIYDEVITSKYLNTGSSTEWTTEEIIFKTNTGTKLGIDFRVIEGVHYYIDSVTLTEIR